MYGIFISLAARKDLDNLSPDIRKRVLDKLEHYRQTPDPLVFAKRLHDDPEGTHRFEVSGDWRAKFEVEGNLLIIKRVRHRSSAYRR